MFQNRAEAGRKLADKLLKKAIDRDNTIIIALPRGGVPVAHEIANKLNLPLDVFSVKKVGHPSNPEYALGAVAEDGTFYFNSVVDLSDDAYEKLRIVAYEKARIQAEQLRAGRPLTDVTGKEIILVDDGIATGATVEAAIKLLKEKDVKKITLAIPVAPFSKVDILSPKVNDLLILETPKHFWAVGEWYRDFPQVTNDQVKKVLDETIHLRETQEIQNHWP